MNDQMRDSIERLRRIIEDEKREKNRSIITKKGKTLYIIDRRRIEKVIY
jgi:hypothetical protein